MVDDEDRVKKKQHKGMTRITELKEAELESRESRYYRDAGTCFVPGQRQRWWRPAQKAAVRVHRLTLQKAV